MLPVTFEQAADGCIDNDLLETLGLDHLAMPSGFDCFSQQPLNAFFTDALAPARHRRGVRRQLAAMQVVGSEATPMTSMTGRLTTCSNESASIITKPVI